MGVHTGSVHTRTCQEPGGCRAETNRWRQCPDNSCRREIVFCTAHGGDAQATERMTMHIELHHRPATNAAEPR